MEQHGDESDVSDDEDVETDEEVLFQGVDRCHRDFSEFEQLMNYPEDVSYLHRVKNFDVQCSQFGEPVQKRNFYHEGVQCYVISSDESSSS